MRCLLIITGLFALICPAFAQDTPQVADLKAALRPLSEGSLLEEFTAVEQAAAKARSDSGAGMELRPSFSEDDSELAVRLYLPSRWTKSKLREQLSLVAQSETLRVDALEWQELMAVYRDFCTYRMLCAQVDLLTAEIDRFSPYLAQADRQVQQHQLAVIDRAKLTGQILDLLNDRAKIETGLLSVQTALHQVLGTAADLDAFAATARLAPPVRTDLDELIEQALENRADYRQLGIKAQSLNTAAAIAHSEEGFHFKHIQYGYKMDQTGEGQDSWNVSAAFSLPWGNRNPDAAVYRQQQSLTVSTMALQRRIISERIQSRLDTLEKLTKQLDQRNQMIQPLIEQLTVDLKQMETGPLEQVRDRLTLRTHLLDAALQTTRMECDRDRLVVDLADELGAFGN